MSRNGSGVYSLPAAYLVASGDDVLPNQHNTPLEDLETDANTARPIVAGGTGATSASDARDNLGLTIGTNVQAYGAVLDDLNTLGANSADGEFLVGTGAGALAWESGATARASLGLTIGTNVQAYDAGLQSISGLTTAANKMLYTTALDTYAVADLTAFARTLLDDADAATARATLGVTKADDETDTTTGRVAAFINYPNQSGSGLPFGLGATHAITIQTAVTGSNDADDLSLTGFYATAASTTNGPESGFGHVIFHSQFNADEAAQFSIARSGDVYTRRKTSSTWEDWFNQSGEYGSNANGEYVRYADGTQICLVEGVTLSFVGGRVRASITFPASFANTDYVSSGTFRGAADADGVSIASAATPASNEILPPFVVSKTTTTAVAFAETISGLTAFVSGDEMYADFMFLGRWF